MPGSEHISSSIASSTGDNFHLYVGIIITLGICILLVTALFYYVRQRIAVLEHSHKEQVMVLHDFIKGTSNDLEIMKHMLMNIPVVFNGQNMSEKRQFVPPMHSVNGNERNTKLIHISTDDEEERESDDESDNDNSGSSDYDSDDQSSTSSSSKSSNTTASDTDIDIDNDDINDSENNIKVVELIDGMPIDYINGKHTSEYVRGVSDKKIIKDMTHSDNNRIKADDSHGSDSSDTDIDTDTDTDTDTDNDVPDIKWIDNIQLSPGDLDIKCIHIDNVSDSSVSGQGVSVSSRDSVASSNSDNIINIQLSDVTTIPMDDIKHIHIVEEAIHPTVATVPAQHDVAQQPLPYDTMTAPPSIASASKKSVPSTPLKPAAMYMNVSVGDLRQILRDKIKELNIPSEKVMEYGDIAKLKKPSLIKILQEL